MKALFVALLAAATLGMAPPQNSADVNATPEPIMEACDGFVDGVRARPCKGVWFPLEAGLLCAPGSSLVLSPDGQCKRCKRDRPGGPR